MLFEQVRRVKPADGGKEVYNLTAKGGFSKAPLTLSGCSSVG
jgi:hypothetical protein